MYVLDSFFVFLSFHRFTEEEEKKITHNDSEFMSRVCFNESFNFLVCTPRVLFFLHRCALLSLRLISRHMYTIYQIISLCVLWKFNHKIQLEIYTKRNFHTCLISYTLLLLLFIWFCHDKRTKDRESAFVCVCVRVCLCMSDMKRESESKM